MTGQTDLINLTFVEVLLIAGALFLGLVCGGIAIGLYTDRSLRRAKQQAEEIIRSAESTASNRAKDIQLAAERQAAERRSEIDREVKLALQSMQESQVRTQKIQETLERKLEHINDREVRLDQQDKANNARQTELTQALSTVTQERESIQRRLSEIAGLTVDQAREIFLEDVRNNSLRQAAVVEHKIIAEAELKAGERAREITLMAIQRYAAETVSDSTIRSVKIPQRRNEGAHHWTRRAQHSCD